MADYRRILGLLFQGRSYREIVAAVGCSHRDVASARRAIEEQGVTAEQLAGMAETDLLGLFPDGRSRVSGEYDPPDFARAASSMRHNQHFTLLQAWRSYVSWESGRRKYGYAQYCHLFNEYAVRHDIVATLHHEPGRAVFVDWAGDTIPIVDAVSGETVKAYLFVAVLPFSGYLFVRAFTNMRMDTWISAHVSAFEFFVGVPQITVPDNALTATHRKKRGDAARFVTDRYRQFADHYGTAIVPARVDKPRDKAAVESAVNTVNKRIIGYLLEEVWTTLADVNSVIVERVDEVNHGIRRVDGTTRFERFRDEEAPLLKRLPGEAFEEVAWKELKVGRNYHVTTDYQHYSVPYALAGQLLRVRITSSHVSVFSGQRIVAEHARKNGRKGQYSTNPAHVPPQHKDIAGLWSRRWFIDRANSIGPATTQVIEQLLDRYEIEAQSYLDCQNILGTLGKNKQKLEAACQQLLNMRGSATYSTIKRLIATTSSDQQIPPPARAAASNTKNEQAHDAGAAGALVRGADYYREDGDKDVH
jgi:transposase